MQYVEFNLTTIIINEYFTWQWVMGSRICKGILVMFVQGQLAGAVSASMDYRYWAVGIGNCQWANVMGSVQIEYKQYQQIGGNIYCEIQKIHQDPKTLFFIYVCLVIKENENNLSRNLLEYWSQDCLHWQFHSHQILIKKISYVKEFIR